MNIDKIGKVYFSPTKTTQKIVDEIAENIICNTTETLDITVSANRENKSIDFYGDLAIIGSPVHHGRVPVNVKDYFKNTKVKDVYAVLVVVYGNRHFDDSLIELYDIACKSGFIPIACAAFIGEHSFSSSELPIAHERPDNKDLARAKSFGIEIHNNFDILINAGNNALHLPGNRDYESNKIADVPLAPKTLRNKCTTCNKCIDVCPVSAITSDKKTDKKSCIFCFACVKSCPTNARSVNHILFSLAKKKLYKKCTVRKESEFFLPISR